MPRFIKLRRLPRHLQRNLRHLILPRHLLVQEEVPAAEVILAEVAEVPEAVEITPAEALVDSLVGLVAAVTRLPLR
jgi:hypothetical protein